MRSNKLSWILILSSFSKRYSLEEYFNFNFDSDRKKSLVVSKDDSEKLSVIFLVSMERVAMGQKDRA